MDDEGFVNHIREKFTLRCKNDRQEKVLKVLLLIQENAKVLVDEGALSIKAYDSYKLSDLFDSNNLTIKAERLASL